MKFSPLVLSLLAAPAAVVAQSPGQATLADLWALGEADLIREDDNGVLTVSFSHGSAGTP